MPVSILSTDSVQLQGELETLTGDTTVSFQYRKKGQTTWQETSGQTLSSAGTFSAEVTGLDEGDVYEYRSKAAAGGQTAFGLIKAFELAFDVSVRTDLPEKLNFIGKEYPASATLRGSIEAAEDVSSGDFLFQYRKTGNTTWQEAGRQAASSPGDFSAEVTGLDTSSKYEYRARIEPSSGNPVNGQIVPVVSEIVEDFEGGITDWTINDSNIEVTEQDSVNAKLVQTYPSRAVPSGTSSIRFNADPSETRVAELPVPVERPGVIRWYFQNLNTSSERDGQAVHVLDEEGNLEVAVGTYQGDLIVWDGDGDFIEVERDIGQGNWHRVELQFDFENGEYTYELKQVDQENVKASGTRSLKESKRVDRLAVGQVPGESHAVNTFWDRFEIRNSKDVAVETKAQFVKSEAEARLEAKVTELSASETDIKFIIENLDSGNAFETSSQTIEEAGETAEKTVSGLQSGSNYRYRAVAATSSSTDLGAYKSFETVDPAGAATTAHWDFNRLNIENGDLIDQTGNGNDVSLQNINETDLNFDGKIGDAFNFANDNLPIRNLNYTNAGEISDLAVSAWIENDGGINGSDTILSFDGADYYEIQTDRFATEDESGGVNFLDFNEAQGSEDWKQVSVRFAKGDDVQKVVYVDGKPVVKEPDFHKGNALGNGSSTRYGFIGERSNANNFNGNTSGNNLNARLSDLKLHDTTSLSESQLQIRYTKESVGLTVEQAEFVTDYQTARLIAKIDELPFGTAEVKFEYKNLVNENVTQTSFQAVNEVGEVTEDVSLQSGVVYRYKAILKQSSNQTVESNAVEFALPDQEILNLTGSLDSETNEASLDWETPVSESNETYNVYRKDSEDTVFTQVASGLTEDNYTETLTTVDPDPEYEVSSVIGGTESPRSRTTLVPSQTVFGSFDLTTANADSDGSPDTGPTQNQLDNEYTGTPLEGKVTSVGEGWQEFSVVGDVSLRAEGAEGGRGDGGSSGNGAILEADFEFSSPTKLRVAVGHGGINRFDNEGSGGGGTFILREDPNGDQMFDGETYSPLLVAGAGGGGGFFYDEDGKRGNDDATFANSGASNGNSSSGRGYFRIIQDNHASVFGGGGDGNNGGGGGGYSGANSGGFEIGGGGGGSFISSEAVSAATSTGGFNDSSNEHDGYNSSVDDGAFDFNNSGDGRVSVVAGRLPSVQNERAEVVDNQTVELKVDVTRQRRVDPSVDVEVHFEYRKQGDSEFQESSGDAFSFDGYEKTISEQVSGLESETVYEFKGIVTGKVGSSETDISTFEIPSAITTVNSFKPSSSEGVLIANVDRTFEYENVDVRFEYDEIDPTANSTIPDWTQVTGEQAVSEDDTRVSQFVEGVEPQALEVQEVLDIENFVYNDVEKDLNSRYGGFDTGRVSGVAFNNDETKMFVTSLTDQNVYEYVLSDPSDVSTASFNNASFDTGGQTSESSGLLFNDDGTKLYSLDRADGNPKIYEYDLSTGFDVSTASYNGVFLDASSESNRIFATRFNSDGTKIYVGDNTANVNQYSLSTAYDLSTASYSGKSFDTSSQNSNAVNGLVFSNDETKMYAGFGGFSGGISIIYEYDLSTAGDVTTASYTTGSSFDVTSEVDEGYLRGMAISSDEEKFYVSGGNYDQPINSVFQYDTGFGNIIEETFYVFRPKYEAPDGTTQLGEIQGIGSEVNVETVQPEFPGEFLDFESGFDSQWTVNDNAVRPVSDRAFSGSQSVSTDGNSPNREILAERPISTDTQKISFYWQETTNQSGAGFRVINSNGNREVEFGTNNPQWELADGTGTGNQVGNPSNSYNNWTLVRFTFDFSAGTYDYKISNEEDGGNTTVRGTRDLQNGVDAAKIALTDPDFVGSPDSMWWDAISIGDLSTVLNPGEVGDIESLSAVGSKPPVENTFRITFSEDFEDGLGSEWTVNDENYEIDSSRVFSGSKSFHFDTNPSETIIAERAVAENTEKISWYFQSNYNGPVFLHAINSNGDLETAVGMDNQDFDVYDGDGNPSRLDSFIADDTWHFAEIEFDFDAGEYTLRYDEVVNGNFQTFTRSLKNGVDISKIGLGANPGSTQNINGWWDLITVSTSVDSKVVVDSTAAENVTATGAKLNANLRQGVDKNDAEVRFDYREVGSDDWTELDVGVRSSAGTFTETIPEGTLNEGLNYEFRGAGDFGLRNIAAGDVDSISTLAVDDVSTGGATSITASSATLNGTVADLASGSTADVSFEYREVGTSTFNTLDAGTVSSEGNFSETLPEGTLAENVQYEYKAVATADGTTSEGSLVTFSTADEVVEVTTGSASGVDATGATLSGTLDTLQNTPDVDLAFDYGPSGNVTANRTTPQTVSSTGSFSQTITGLDQAVDYEFRIVAIGQAETVGNNATFTTDALEVSTTGSSAVGAGTATVEGNVDHLNDTNPPADVSFNFGIASPDTNQSAGTAGEGQAFTTDLTGLQPGSTYQFQARGTDSGATGETDVGQNLTFTTQNVEVSVVSISSPNPTELSVEGSLDINETSSAVSLSVEYKKQSDSTFTSVSVGSQTATGTFTQAITGLEAGVTYDVRVAGDIDTTTVLSAVQAAETEDVAVETVSANQVGAGNATLEGNLTQLASDETATVSFDFGPTGNPNQSTSGQSVSSTGTYTTTITGLDEDTDYEFRANVQADGSGETDVGQLQSFTTQNVDLAANSATPTGPDAVDVTGEVVINETGNAIDLEVQYKKSSETSFTNTTDAGTQASTGTFTQSVSGLEAGIDYDFRVVGVVDTTTITSGSVSAETQEVNVSTTGTSSVDTESAVLEGSLDEIGPSETDVDVKFQYGTPGNVTMLETSPVTLSSTGAFSETVSGLAEDTQFEFRAVATGNQSGDQDFGQILTFTTTDLDNVTNSITAAGASEISAEGEITNYAGSQNVSVFFEYRKTGASSFNTESAGTLSSPGVYTASITGLEIGAEYEARAVAEVESTRVEGALQTVELDGISFDGAPSVTSKTTSSVTAEAVVDELQASTTTDVLITYSEQGGTDSGSVVAENISQTKTVSAQITGLNVGSTYDLQAEATVDGRTVTSAIQSADLSSVAVSTKPNTATSATNVTLNGSLDSLESGQSATVSFEYGSAAVDDNETSGQSLSSIQNFSKEVTGLAADTQYEYRAKGVEGSDTDLGQIRTFTTDTIAVSAESPSSIGAGAATLEGQIDVLASSQADADAFFEYGKQSGSVTDNSTAAQTGLAQGDPISQSVTGLEPGATYEVRVVGTANPSGDSVASSVQTFTTDNITVSTTSATSAGSTSFDASGSLDINETGGSVSVGFEYSTDTSFDQEVSAGTAASGSFAASVSGLTAGTTYNVRAYAESGGSRVVGTAVQVTTRAITVSTEPATSVNVGSATLEGNVDNGSGDVQFQYGKTQSFGSSTVLTSVSSTGSFSEDITGLQRNEQYFYRIRGESSGDVDTGSTQSFTTDNITVSTITPPPSKTVSSLTLRAEVDTFTGDNTITAGIELVQSGGDFSNATVKSETLTSTGLVTKQFTGLSEDTSYDFKAFAEVDGVRVEGSVKTDSTLSTTMSISPTSHNFGTSDGQSTKTFTVTNTGTASLSGLSASGLSGDFSENGLNSSTLSPGGSTNVTVTYDPSSISDDSDTLNISANETASASASVSGSGIPEDPSISVSPSSHDFGTASASETKQFTITNDGNVDLGSVSASGLGGDFSSNGVQDSFLTPGEQTTITVTYDPTSTASDSDTLSITTDSPDASANLGVAVNGDGIPENPDVSISPTSFDFGTASGSETKQFTVTNDGNIDLTGLSASGLSGDFSEGGLSSSTLSPGSNTTVTVTYNPSSISSDNDTLNISANESTSASANVSGDGIPENPEISISPTSKNFGTGSGSQTFTLTNDGNVDLGNVSASGLSGDFSENGVSDSFFTPGEQTTVTVDYNPSTIDSDSDTLNISTDRAASASASLSGDGVPENPQISISPTSFDFGTGSGSKTFTLENTGNVDLGSVSASGLSGDFSSQAVADSFLTPNETTTVTVDYNPSTIDSDSDTLNISTDRTASASANVSGDGVPENPSISISPTSFDFGEVSSSDTKQFTIENTGNVDLGSVSASGLSGDFSENGVGDSFLTPNESTNVTVTYNPNDINSDSDTLDISTDRTASASANVSGDGVPENPSMSVSPTNHDFGTVDFSSGKSFTLTNTGNVSLTGISGSGLSNEYSIGVDTLPSSLSPGASDTFDILYTPSSTSSSNDTLNISANQSASASVSVSGSGNPSSGGDGGVRDPIEF